ncbi:hypothetical protein TOPH_03000, partial [Tolypocladium ophioglossoides CBS 100239]
RCPPAARRRSPQLQLSVHPTPPPGPPAPSPLLLSLSFTLSLNLAILLLALLVWVAEPRTRRRQHHRVYWRGARCIGLQFLLLSRRRTLSACGPATHSCPFQSPAPGSSSPSDEPSRQPPVHLSAERQRPPRWSWPHRPQGAPTSRLLRPTQTCSRPTRNDDQDDDVFLYRRCLPLPSVEQANEAPAPSTPASGIASLPHPDSRPPPDNETARSAGLVDGVGMAHAVNQRRTIVCASRLFVHLATVRQPSHPCTTATSPDSAMLTSTHSRFSFFLDVFHFSQ